MTGPYPDAETAAHMIAEEIYAHRRSIRDGTSRAEITRRHGIIDGLRRAAWLLNVEDMVGAKSRDSGRE